MTDLNNWPKLIRVVQLPAENSAFPEGTLASEYVMVPLNEYQIGNLLGMLKDANPTGDWHQELIAICAVAMRTSGYLEARSNNGYIFRVEDVERGVL